MGDPILRLTPMPKQMPITVMGMVMVTDTLMVTDHTIMERGALMPNLMVTTAMLMDMDMVTLTIVVIMVISLANEVLMPMLMLMLTITVILLTVWDPFTVMVTTPMHPVTMVTTWASVALKKNLDLILNLMPMVTIPAITVDGDTVDMVDTVDITGAKLTDQTTSLFS